MPGKLEGLEHTSKKRLGQKFGFYINALDKRIYCLRKAENNFELENDFGRTFRLNKEEVDLFLENSTRIDSPPASIVGLVFSNVNGETITKEYAIPDDYD